MVLEVEAPSRLAPTMALQIFTIGSAIAGGLAGMKLGSEFAEVKDVPTNLVVGATIASILFTLGAGLYLARKAKEVYG